MTVYQRWQDSGKLDFISLLTNNPEARVIDLGCGSGEFSDSIRRVIGCKQIFGCDIYEKWIKYTDEVAVFKIDLDRKVLPFDDKSFDVITANQVIEHLFNPAQFMKEVFRILRPNGYAVISTENLSSWDNVVALFFGYTPFSIQYDKGFKLGSLTHNKDMLKGENPHIRLFTGRGFIDLAEVVGFKVVDTVGIGTVFRKRFMAIKLRKKTGTGNGGKQ